MRTLTTALLLLAPLPTLVAQSAPSRLTLGIGVASIAAYPGSDDRRVLPLPIIQLDLGRVYVGGGSTGATGGIGAYVIRSRHLTWTVDVGGSLNRRADWSNDLAGFGDRDAGVSVGTGMTLTLGPVSASVAVAEGIVEGFGRSGRAQLGVQQMIGQRLILGGGIGATLSNAEHMAWDFGISAKDALGSGRAAFTPRAGLRDVSATFAPAVVLTPRIMIAGFASVTRYGDRAAASPLVQRRTVIEGGIGIVRRM